MIGTEDCEFPEEYHHAEDNELYFEYGDSEYQDYESSEYQNYENSEYQEYENLEWQTADNYEETEHFGETSQEVLFSCEQCDRDFYSKSSYDRHMSEHRTCNLDGCKFTAHEKIIEKHVLMQHATGLYDKIRNINTPEDIAKWIEERKRRFPSKENILKRQEKQELMLKRGERIKKNENRFGRDKFRLAKSDNKRAPPKKKTKRPFVKEKKPVSLINEKIDWNGTVYPFKGISMLESDSEKEQSDFEDEEWTITPSKPVTIKLNNALGALMGAYMSGSETDEEDNKKIEIKPEAVKAVAITEVNVETKSEEIKQDSDGEPPTEIKIKKETLPEPVIEKKESQITVNSGKSRKRKRPHNRFNKPQHSVNRNRRNLRHNFKNKNPNSAKNKDFPYGFRKRKVTLLEKLLENDIRHERNTLLQCVRYTVENNFFRDNPSTSSGS